jgi:uncharacterized protein
MHPPDLLPNAVISIWISPGASRNEVIGLIGNVWKVRITAPPVEGRANDMLLEFLSDKLGIKRNRLDLLKGFTSRHKIVSVVGLNAAEISKRLASLPG